MSDVRKNPVTEPQDDLFEPRHSDFADYPQNIAGPGGASIYTENNEKGILEKNVFRALGTHQQAELGADHASYRQGIYGSQGTTYGS